MSKTKVVVKRRGRSLRPADKSLKGRHFTFAETNIYKVHLLVTRPTGDVEAYQMARIPAWEVLQAYKRRLVSVRVPSLRSARRAA